MMNRWVLYTDQEKVQEKLKLITINVGFIIQY